ncbi:MAG: LTA synthase family protein [Sphingobacteriales bacterium]|nr:LTA synthase family protein [Sphingobacteriales bacterium]MBI3718687.1 LTA synthase family protein [Sphingobacteriales bacterium]
MGKRLLLPPTARWVLKLFWIFLGVFTLFRIATLIAFMPTHEVLGELWPSFLLGLRYDIRWICIVLSPLLVFGSFTALSPFYSRKNKKWWIAYLTVIALFILLFFGADFGHFGYISTRLNASALNFMEDFRTSMAMIWESYPIFWILLGLGLIVWLITKLVRHTHAVVEKSHNEKFYFRSGRVIWLVLLMFIGIYGKPSAKPLVWKDAFLLGDNFKAYLALNPMQNFFTTLKFRNPSFNTSNARQYYPAMAKFLGIDKQEEYLDFKRTVAAANEKQMNVVLVVCESFSMYKSSMSGNPLNTTPYFNQMSKEGVFFEKCFSPHFGTARGVFALMTGIPDVQLSKFSTRNPEALTHHTIINDFTDYNKYYFIGGNSEFNNFRGLIQQNVKNVKIYDENSYQSPKFNVWGISDKNLFKEANNVLKQNDKPFFAIIQTADNHRPFEIPQEDKDFVKQYAGEETLKANGFESLDEYNAFRYADYCIQHFINDAKKEAYFNNTLFVFVGDHGVQGDANAVYPNAWTEQRLSDEHVPLLFYAPGILQPQLRKEITSQIDVLPTIAGIAGKHYTNQTLGRDLLNTKPGGDCAFIIHHDEGNIGVVTNEFYYIRNIQLQNDTIVSVTGKPLTYTDAQLKNLRSRMSTFTTGYYETAKWMLCNNKP